MASRAVAKITRSTTPENSMAMPRRIARLPKVAAGWAKQAMPVMTNSTPTKIQRTRDVVLRMECLSFRGSHHREESRRAEARR